MIMGEEIIFYPYFLIEVGSETGFLFNNVSFVGKFLKADPDEDFAWIDIKGQTRRVRQFQILKRADYE